MPKFSFPIPGRKAHRSKDADKHISYSRPAHSPSAVSNGSGFSKAQRFFGMDNDLNIDSPTRDDDSWMISSSRSSVMSISISESTHSTRTTNDTGSVPGSQNDKWESEGGKPTSSAAPELNTRASSTILGARYGEGEGSVTTMSARLRNEDSSSTLKSFYDRHNSPLAISQQTSASSSRDLALRKGLPKVVPASPLLHVESVESIDSMVVSRDGNESDKRGSRKKPAKLDLSMLFPKPGRFLSRSPDTTERPSTASGAVNAPASGPRKLTKAMSKESLKSFKSMPRSGYRPTSQSLPEGKVNQSQLQPTYAHSQAQRVPMDLIPESLVPERRSKIVTSTYLKPPSNERSGQNRESRSNSGSTAKSHVSDEASAIMAPPRPWDDSSAASVSSNNTKGSKRTNNSTFSNTDLQQKSVLSLSSDSEGGDSDLEELVSPKFSSGDKAARILNGSISTFNKRPASQHSANSAPRTPRKRNTQIDQFPSIPETTMPNPRISGPWMQSEGPTGSQSSTRSSHRVSVRQSRTEQQLTGQHLAVPDNHRQSPLSPKEARKPGHSQKRMSRKESLSSQRSLQPTPPISPTSIEFRADPEDSNRFMAVTKQEEALLAALRQKRAKMRERIIEEHETGNRSPPRTADDIQSSFYAESNSSPIADSRDSLGPSKQTVLMYLESPISEAQRIYTAEPSPDLSDFLGFGSDEDTTPRTSWVTPRRLGAPRPDSTISPHPRLDRSHASGKGTPNSAARLSAVGVSGGFGDKQKSTGRTQSVRKKTSNVRFKEEVIGDAENDDDDGVVWGL